ncbi:Ankyrin repeat and SAM domain-containing protein [Drosera capensis]
MYADREDQGKRAIKERLNGTSIDDSASRRTITGKRQRQEEKWEHDLYKDRKLDARDLRLKLQRKDPTMKRGIRDLREKLSGSMHSQPMNADAPAPAPKVKPEPETSRAARKSNITEPSAADSRKVTNSTIKKKAQQKVDVSVDGFLQSLGLEKYLIAFQAEEVDMATLQHLTEGDLKAIGIPMGPRKKILLALEGK